MYAEWPAIIVGALRALLDLQVVLLRTTLTTPMGLPKASLATASQVVRQVVLLLLLQLGMVVEDQTILLGDDCADRCWRARFVHCHDNPLAFLNLSLLSCLLYLIDGCAYAKRWSRGASLC